MKISYLVAVFTVFALVNSATIHKRDSIPVKILYERSINHGVKNLEEKVQLPSDDIEKPIIKSGNLGEAPAGNENLQEKTQLPTENKNEELVNTIDKEPVLQKDETQPAVEQDLQTTQEVEKTEILQPEVVQDEKVTPDNSEPALTEQSNSTPNQITEDVPQQIQQEVLPTPPKTEIIEEPKPLQTDESLKSNAVQDEKIETPAVTQEPVVVEKPNETLFQQIHAIISQGLHSIKNKVNGMANALEKPSEEAWKDLNKTVEQFLIDNQYTETALKQNNENQNPSTQSPVQNQFVQNIINGFQNAASNFVQNFQQNQGTANGTEDEQQGSGGWGQNVINSIQGGFQQVINNIQNLNQQQSSTSNTNLSDTGTGSSTQSPNFVNNVINSFQQFFGGQGQGQGNPIQSVGLQQGDTGVSSTTQRNPGQIFQQIGNQIGSAIFGQNNKPPGGSEDEGSSTTQSTNFIQNIGQAIQNFNPLRPQIPGQGGQAVDQSQGGSNNPVVGSAQVVGNQIQQGLQNAINQNPLSSSTTQSSREGSTETGQVAESTKQKLEENKEKTVTKND